MYLPSLPDIGRLLARPCGAGAADAVLLPGRLRHRPDRLWADVRPLRPQAGAARGARTVHRREHRLCACALDRDSDHRALLSGARADPAQSCWRAPSCAISMTVPAPASELSLMGSDHGARADRRAARGAACCRPSPAGGRTSWSLSLSACGRSPSVWLLLPETLRQPRAASGFRCARWRACYRACAQPCLPRLSRHRHIDLMRIVRVAVRLLVRAAGLLRPVAHGLRMGLRRSVPSAISSALSSRRASSPARARPHDRATAAAGWRSAAPP